MTKLLQKELLNVHVSIKEQLMWTEAFREKCIQAILFRCYVCLNMCLLELSGISLFQFGHLG